VLYTNSVILSMLSLHRTQNEQSTFFYVSMLKHDLEKN